MTTRKARKAPPSPVTAVYKARISKLGYKRVNATHVSQDSCDPAACRLHPAHWGHLPPRKRPCYAGGGTLGWTTSRLNAASSGANRRLTPEDFAELEADALDRLRGNLPTRLHGVGDCSTFAAAYVVSAAAHRYMDRTNAPVWTYTHSWRNVGRSAWGRVSVLASVETLEDAARALSVGYAPAIIVKEHASAKAERHTVNGRTLTVIPCPEQTGRAKDCVACRLCFDDEALKRRNAVIALQAHGTGCAAVHQIIDDAAQAEALAAADLQRARATAPNRLQRLVLA